MRGFTGAILALAVGLCACAGGVRRFVDRPVAWQEHDDENVTRVPHKSGVAQTRIARGMFDLMVREVNRTLSLEWRRPAADVNSADEVPCSTWFCPKNHAAPVAPAEIAKGPPTAIAPALPLTIVAGNNWDKDPGVDVIDAAGRAYRLEFDPRGHAGLASGAEAVCQRLLWAAGYNVGGAFVVDLDPSRDIQVGAHATVLHHGYLSRPFTERAWRSMVGAVGITAAGKLRVAAIPVLGGVGLGAFDFSGTRADDPNDRIPHEHRRSLRGLHVIAAWLGAADLDAADTQDVLVSEDGKRFVRHYFVNLSAGLGAARFGVKGPWHGREKLLEPMRILGSALLLGLWARPWQDDRAAWREAQARAPAVGWFEAETWEPADFRTSFPMPAQVRMTERDAYWAAKLVTSFTDDQIRAAVSAGGYDAADAAYVAHALAVRRDRIGLRWLTRVAAVERPHVDDDGARLCFEDYAIAHGVVGPKEVRYGVSVLDPRKKILVTERWSDAASATTCLAVGVSGDVPYRVIRVASMVAGRVTLAARVHVAWRASERRFVVVGMERDE